MVRSVTRQIEPEWDDDTRNLVDALALHDMQCCAGCGTHKSVRDNLDDHHFTFEEDHCEVCAARARYSRVVAERDEDEIPRDQNGKPAWSGPRDPRPDDGRHIYLRRMTATEVEQRRRDAAQGLGQR